MQSMSEAMSSSLTLTPSGNSQAVIGSEGPPGRRHLAQWFGSPFCKFLSDDGGSLSLLAPYLL